MNKLDPNALFALIATDIPQELHGELFVAGSLAVAYHFQAQLEGRAVNTKDADLVVHPSGNVAACGRMAKKLLDLGWKRTKECYPQAEPYPTEKLRAIRLYPPNSRDYYLEFLSLPQPGQTEAKPWIPIKMDDGYYGLPCFRFFNIISLHRLKSAVGIEYASPSMMALANLLAHPRIGSSRIESGTMEGLLRSAKDLGRVLALAHLSGRQETESWPVSWWEALKCCFPGEWRTLAIQAGEGLKELLDDENALEESRQTTEAGLLQGMNISAQNLKAIGQRLFVDVIEPLVELAKFDG